MSSLSVFTAHAVNVAFHLLLFAGSARRPADPLRTREAQSQEALREKELVLLARGRRPCVHVT